MGKKIEYAVLYLCVLAKSSSTKTERESAGVKRTPSTSNSTSSTTTTSKGEITLSKFCHIFLAFMSWNLGIRYSMFSIAGLGFVPI